MEFNRDNIQFKYGVVALTHFSNITAKKQCDKREKSERILSRYFFVHIKKNIQIMSCK